MFFSNLWIFLLSIQTLNGCENVKCPHNDKCVEHLKDCPIAPTTDNVDPMNETSFPDQDGYDQWGCTDGHLIHKYMVCDGVSNCDDWSDEIKGCKLFPETGM